MPSSCRTSGSRRMYMSVFWDSTIQALSSAPKVTPLLCSTTSQTASEKPNMQIGEAGAVSTSLDAMTSTAMPWTSPRAGLNGQIFLTHPAPIWRWRDAVQHESAARMQWTLRPRDANPTTSHPLVSDGRQRILRISRSESHGRGRRGCHARQLQRHTRPTPTLASMLLGSSTTSLVRARRSRAK
jgi:hypothetical protein